MTILEKLLAAQAAGEAVALATVVETQGSVPRHAGSKMLVYEDGRTYETVGGGELEARVVAAARDALQDSQPRLVRHSLVDPERGDPGVCGGEMAVFVEPYGPPLTLFVVGCGHVGQALADLGHWAGYRVVVWDDRPGFATPENIPHANIYLSGEMAAALAEFPVTRNTYVAVVTRNVLVDQVILPHLLRTPAPYIGVMGSRRRWVETSRLLLADGLAETDLARCHSPIGLPLQAESPAEIAISILAEITLRRRDPRAVSPPPI